MMKNKKKLSQEFEHWGQRLQKVMTENKKSQRDIARLCNTSVSVVSAWIKNGSSPTDLIAIKKLSEELQVSFSWLLTGTYESDAAQPAIAQIFDETPYFDGYARIRIDRLIPKIKKENKND